MSRATTSKVTAVIASVIACIHLSGCDRFSEKEKMEMITMCDTMSRRHITQKDETEHNLLSIHRKIEVTTHYSFNDSRCYAQESSMVLIVGGNNPSAVPTVWISETLYDGMTKEKLLAVSSGPVLGVSGSLKKNGMTQGEALTIIKQKMTNP